MTNANILTNKPATASNSFAPFLPGKAVDGTISPASRWAASIVPAWLCVDLQGYYYIQQWKLTFMSSGALNPQNAPVFNSWSAYYMRDFKLQGTTDGANWFDMDSLTGNSASDIDRVCTPRLCRYVRVYVTKGLSNNNSVASIVDFQAAEVTNPPFLSNLVPSVGVLSPAFNSRTLNYSMNVGNGVGSIAFTPTSGSGMQIKVNNAPVNSGSQSAQIPLSAGANTITVTVTSATVGTTTYTITVTKAGNATLLNGLTIIDSSTEAEIPLVPSFVPTTMDYIARVNASVTSVMVCPSVGNPSASIMVDDITVASGDYSVPIALTSANTVITIKVMVAGGDTTRYTITVEKQ